METKELSNSLLKGKMTDAMVHRGICQNLDTCFAQGIYNTTSSTACSNPPNMTGWNYGIVEVFERGSMILQRVTSFNTCASMSRVCSTTQLGQWT